MERRLYPNEWTRLDPPLTGKWRLTLLSLPGPGQRSSLTIFIIERKIVSFLDQRITFWRDFGAKGMKFSDILALLYCMLLPALVVVVVETWLFGKNLCFTLSINNNRFYLDGCSDIIFTLSEVVFLFPLFSHTPHSSLPLFSQLLLTSHPSLLVISSWTNALDKKS